MEGLRLDRRPEAGGDLLGRRIGLLGAQPTVLDREVGAVARRVEVVSALDPGVVIDRDEAPIVGGEPRD